MKRITSPQLRNRPRKEMISDFINNLLWFVFGFMTLLSVNFHVTGILAALQAQSVANKIVLSIAIMNIICLLLTGWYLFSFFVRPGNKKFLPPHSTRTNEGETRRMFWNGIYTESCRSFVIHSTYLIIEGRMISSWYFYGIIIFIVLFGTSSKAYHLIVSQQVNIDDELLSELIETTEQDMEIDVLSKLKRLSLLERKELGDLVYRNDVTRRMTIQGVAIVLLGSIVFAFIIELLEGLVSSIWS